MIKIVSHPRSGERYIFESTETAGGTVYRAVGPLDYTENPTRKEMREEWLFNVGGDALDDGKWLAKELGLVRR